MASFFSSVQRDRSTFLFICSTVQHHEPELRTSKTYFKHQKLVLNKIIDVQNLENIGSPFGVFHSDFFRHYATFLSFLESTKGSPLRLFRYFARQRMSKNPKGPPFIFFGTVTLFKNLNFNFFFGNFQNLPRPPLYFFHILQPTGVSQSPKGPSFTILRLRYSADFGRSRFVLSHRLKMRNAGTFFLITQCRKHGCPLI